MRRIAFSIALVAGVAGVAHAATYQTLYRFAVNTQVVDKHADPTAPLVLDASGAVYGVVNSQYPSAYKLTPPVSGTKWTKSSIFSFPTQANTGCRLLSGLVADKAGNLYGVTTGCWEVDNNGNGAVYELSPPKLAGKAWSGRVIYAFIANNDPVGVDPSPWLTIDGAGNLYGTTAATINEGAGHLYRLSPPASGTGQWSSQRITTHEGGSRVLDISGVLYTEAGVPGSTYGNILKITKSAPATWVYSNIFQFNSDNGANPSGGLIVAAKTGDLYGTALAGPKGLGVAFQLSPPTGASSTWKFTQLHDFGGLDGVKPQTGLTMDTAGNLYGVADCGGKWMNGFDQNSGEGLIFKLVPSVTPGAPWTYSAVYQPPKAFFPTGNCNNTTAFVGPLIVGKDGALYGVANGPAGYGGSVFRLVP